MNKAVVRDRRRSVLSRLIQGVIRLHSNIISIAAGRRVRNGSRNLPPIAVAVRDARELLIIVLSEIGDAVLFSAFLRHVRSIAPGARVTLVVRPEVASLFARSPYVDVLFCYDSAASRALRLLILPVRAYRFALRRLRTTGYDVAIVPRWDVDDRLSVALALFSSARRRVGVSELANERKRILNAGLDSLFTDVLDDRARGHEVEHYMRLVEFLGGRETSAAIEIWLDEADRTVAADRLRSAGVGESERLVAFGIGAAHPKRRWPLERFVELGAALHAQYNLRILLVGGESDAAAQERVRGELGQQAIPMAGALSLSQTGAALERCCLFVGNDSAPMHIAAAAGIPCVEVSFHPRSGGPHHVNSPERFGPWGVPSMIIQPDAADPCCADGCVADSAHCIAQIPTLAVLRACQELLLKSAQSREV